MPPRAQATGRGRRLAGAEQGASQGGLPREQVLEIQRSRLLAGALAAVQRHGYAGVMVGNITQQAKVSRRTFYELFENREACLAALVRDILGAIEAQLTQAGLAGLAWREQVRGGLWVILSFFDREPLLARMLVVESARGGPRIQEMREQALGCLIGALDEGRAHGGTRAAECSALTAEGLVGAALGIVYARLLRPPREGSLVGLLGELMGMIVLPYLGPAAARAERIRGLPRAPVSALPRASGALAAVEDDPLQALPMRVTYRTARVLDCVAHQPGASNRDVADEAGIKDPGQISKLLARLERLGLLENLGEGANTKGERNAWQLTPIGQQVAQRLRVSPGYQSEAA
ncbi:MAG TPA: TetR family transcriptional regulator [Solirubrobacteraceae bacterium]